MKRPVFKTIAHCEKSEIAINVSGVWDSSDKSLDNLKIELSTDIWDYDLTNMLDQLGLIFPILSKIDFPELANDSE